MTGLRTDEIVDVAGDPGCSYCKTKRSMRAYMFINPDRDCIVCDVCVLLLATKLASIGDPEPYAPKGRPN